ncbi:hypothetical protein SRS16P2_00348 (plasmid) [Variovorax sp. SRS16]|uniref:BrnA antitoxin family protein n=1 Tax=Variovorax sp. SRS16 TaxID=282217 RepID=UPI0013185204|nr:BrnA antitoxin family protein [Variovorax sp. SRS16]VTU45832.1 hypothetical protein SRS16P2_00348 [Variovorax sp. SRS16]
MNANKSGSVRSLGSDLAKVDAHKGEALEYDELPELTDDMLARATVNRGGRPRSASSKVLLSVRYSREVVDFFRATGEGWQSRMDGALKEYVAQHSRR